MEDVPSRIGEKRISLGCQDAIADVITNRSYQLRFAQNEAVISNRWRESTASVFFVYDKRVLASDIKDLTQLDAAVERLVKIAKASQKNPDYAGIAKGPFRYARVRPDPKVLSLDEGGKYVEAAISGGTHRHPGAVPETREGRTIHGRVRPAHLWVSDGPDGRTPRRVDRHGGPLPVRQEGREKSRVVTTDLVR